MNTCPWFDDSLALRLVQALLHFLWQGCAVALVAMTVGTTLKRGSAHLRYSFYVAAMLVMVVCLPVTFTLLGDPRNGEVELPSLTKSPGSGTTSRDGAVFPTRDLELLREFPIRRPHLNLQRRRRRVVAGISR